MANRLSRQTTSAKSLVSAAIPVRKPDCLAVIELLPIVNKLNMCRFRRSDAALAASEHGSGREHFITDKEEGCFA